MIPYKDMTTYFAGTNAKLAQKMLLVAEYRTRLISDVVTGQLDVRNVVVPEYTVIEEDVIDKVITSDEGESSEVS